MLKNYFPVKTLNKTVFVVILSLITLTGLYFRLHGIGFGLPHSFHADEPELVEPAVKYTYEIRTIVKEKAYYKLIPVSFVYGTFPTYLLTAGTMTFSKALNVLGHTFDKPDIYVFLRILTAIFSLGLIPIVLLIYKELFEKPQKWEYLLLAFLTALNWKLLVHSHYVNADIYLTILLNLAFLFQLKYLKSPEASLWTWLAGLTFGLAVGTKVTALISLPSFLYLFGTKKDLRSAFAFLFLIYISFALTNPFAIMFANDFVFRILEMRLKEAGMVFDSVNSNPFKYLLNTIFITTPGVFVISLYGKWTSLARNKNNYQKHSFLIANVVIFLLFFSLNARDVTRWLLPILPILLMYAVKGVKEALLLKGKLRKVSGALISLALLIYIYYPALLLKQFNPETPKSAAYEWLRDNVPEEANKLAITEEGLDPLNKLRGIRVVRPKVYTTENAHFDFPPSPIGYDYVILSSKPMQNHKRREVQEKYPYYANKWKTFENTVKNPENFVLIKQFVLPKPNLVRLSDVMIYRTTGDKSK